jgi:hypothetical protein
VVVGLLWWRGKTVLSSQQCLPSPVLSLYLAALAELSYRETLACARRGYRQRMCYLRDVFLSHGFGGESDAMATTKTQGLAALKSGITSDGKVLKDGWASVKVLNGGSF